MNRLEELAKLKDGWFMPPNEPGKGITPEAVESARKVKEGMCLFPTIDGGLQYEFHGVDELFDIQISPDGNITVWIDDNLVGKD